MDKEVWTIILSAASVAAFIRWVIGDYYKRFSDAIKRSEDTDALHNERFAKIETNLAINKMGDENEEKLVKKELENLHKQVNTLESRLTEIIKMLRAH